jgi:hypothetical protein
MRVLSVVAAVREGLYGLNRLPQWKDLFLKLGDADEGDAADGLKLDAAVGEHAFQGSPVHRRRARQLAERVHGAKRKEPKALSAAPQRGLRVAS